MQLIVAAKAQTACDHDSAALGPMLADLQGKGMLPKAMLAETTYGSDENVQAAAASCGLKAVVMWKGSTNDGRFDLQDGTQLTPGDIVLMHFRTDLLVDLQKVFEVCKQQGFAIASLQDYLPA